MDAALSYGQSLCSLCFSLDLFRVWGKRRYGDVVGKLLPRVKVGSRIEAGGNVTTKMVITSTCYTTTTNTCGQSGEERGFAVIFSFLCFLVSL